MKARVLVEAVSTPGGELTLHRHDGDFMIQINREDLMSSRLHGSEDKLASLALAELPPRSPARVLIGGLGLGFTLRAALDALETRPGSKVTVAEIFEAVVRWNTEHLGALAGHPLNDRRTRIRNEDVRSCFDDGPGAWDAILLDVDNGPDALTLVSNKSIYGDRGLERIREGLSPGGIFAVWSAHPDPRFVKRLNKAGFDAKAIPVAARHGGKGSRHVIFIGRRR